jgi:hypothetical protein
LLLPVNNGDEPQNAEDPEATIGELASRCSLCHAALAGEYFTLRGLCLCPGCAEKIRERQRGRGNLRRALLFGFMVAAVLACLWFLAASASGRPLSPIALLAGVVVGLAVHQGSGGCGGLRYQVIAMLLVYVAFVVRFVPPVWGGMADAIKQEHAAAPAAAPPSPAPATAPAPPSAAPQAAVPAPGQPSTFATLKAYFVFTVIAWGLVLASPFLPSTTSPLALLSLAAGMALAFRLNRRPRLRGPFAA